MIGLLRVGLLAVVACATISFNVMAAAPVANTNLDVNVTVTVPHVMRIVWGSGSTAVDSDGDPVEDTTNAVVWNIGSQDFEATITLAAGQPPTLPAYTLSIKNAGTAKVDVQARVAGADTGTATKKWTVDAAPALDVCAIKVNALQLTSANQELIDTLKRADAAAPIDIEFKTPTDSDFTTGDTGIHAFQVKFTATAP